MEDFKGTKIDVQFGIAYTADFEENTYTFEMQKGFTVSAGEYAILPKNQFEKIIESLGKEADND